jgi:hypothetical protein
MQGRREARAAAALAAPGAEGTTPVVHERWTARVAAWTRAYADGLDLPDRTARLGAAVRDHRDPARWAGIAVGAVVLLFWPAPTLSVLIWIVAVVALYLGALAWLENRAAPAAVTGPEGGPAPAADGPAQLTGAAPARGPSLTGGPSVNGVPEPRTSPEPLVPAGLTPEALSTLTGRLDLLVRLGAARDAGVLTDEEFRQEKTRLLGV